MKIYNYIILVFIPVILIGCGGNDYLYTYPVADLYRMGMEKLENGKEDEAREIFDILQGRAPSLADEALYRSGESYYLQKMYDDAYYKYEKLLNRYPASPWCDDAQYKKGLCRLKAAKDIEKDSSYEEEAIIEFMTLIEEYEGSELVDDAKAGINKSRNRLGEKDISIAKYYVRIGEHEASIVYLDYVLLEYGELEIGAETYYIKAQCYEKLDDKEGAIATYTKIRDRFPDTEYAEKAASRVKSLRKK